MCSTLALPAYDLKHAYAFSACKDAGDRLLCSEHQDFAGRPSQSGLPRADAPLAVRHAQALPDIFANRLMPAPNTVDRALSSRPCSSRLAVAAAACSRCGEGVGEGTAPPPPPLPRGSCTCKAWRGGLAAGSSGACRPPGPPPPACRKEKSGE